MRKIEPTDQDLGDEKGSVADEHESTTYYRIRVKGQLDKRWSDCLHGLFAKIRDLGLSLLSVNRVV